MESLLPPIVAIVLALITRQVLLSLFCGIWIGATFAFNLNPIRGLFAVADKYLLNALADADHAAIIIFSLALGGMVGVISKGGGAQGIVRMLSRYAKTRKGGQIATWAMGLLIFFDDYANTLLVGNTMRPVSDRLNISREKLSYIVDSTSAPIASIAIISTWVGFEVGLIDDALRALGLDMNGYHLFIRSIFRSYYAIFCLFLVFIVAWMNRDFGPMLKAERRAMNEGKVLSDTANPLTDKSIDEFISARDVPQRWYNSIVPISVVVIVVLAGICITGIQQLSPDQFTQARQQGIFSMLRALFGKADSFKVLVWGAFAGSLTAMGMVVAQRILKLEDALNAWITGVKSMLLAVLILLFAWGIGAVCVELKTADYVIKITEGLFSPRMLPVLTFAIAAFIAFATGSSWGTLTILVPIIIPLSYKMTLHVGMEAEAAGNILAGTVGGVLSGAAFGDHCSPISDTTVMSSMASGADHIDHVKTQIPYALLAGVVSCIAGYIPSGFGLSPFIAIPAGIGLMIGAVYLLGKKVEKK
jgi:Na+/H+ antiporter NhaC